MMEAEVWQIDKIKKEYEARRLAKMDYIDQGRKQAALDRWVK